MSLTRLSFVVTGALAVAAGFGPAFAADDGYQDVLSSVATAIGIMTPDTTPNIDYRERAPLVLPPKMELVKPSASLARPASWPQDPDVTRRNRAASGGRAPLANSSGNGNPLLSRDELMQGRINGEGADAPPESALRTARCGMNGNGRGCLVESPDKLKAEGDHYAATNPDTGKGELQPGQEPDRVYLTQPPKGYLKATKVVKATTEAPKPITDTANPNAALVYKPKPEDE
ncbi:hypothetical protein [Lichenifustis flavocetrariae]|uniref:Uncharacterized protein n=1 Tax=Lichenifustis flavocetrariae TaxID=2949735 RepID=A0AA42CPL0_9HYPH|nr:hypothetical protein [Lichenifustis flavocetrariae]MCW6510490.1 hypothetical protein [Lichenifustis flavocetrariae]